MKTVHFAYPTSEVADKLKAKYGVFYVEVDGKQKGPYFKKVTHTDTKARKECFHYANNVLKDIPYSNWMKIVFDYEPELRSL